MPSRRALLGAVLIFNTGMVVGMIVQSIGPLSQFPVANLLTIAVGAIVSTTFAFLTLN